MLVEISFSFVFKINMQCLQTNYSATSPLYVPSGGTVMFGSSTTVSSGGGAVIHDILADNPNLMAYAMGAAMAYEVYLYIYTVHRNV
jgi:hypothetical protein